MSFSYLLELVDNLPTRLKVSEELDKEDKELIMELSPIDRQRLETATQERVKQTKRMMLEEFLRFRFGSIDEELSAIIEKLMMLPYGEIPRSLFQLSREELLASF